MPATHRHNLAPFAPFFLGAALIAIASIAAWGLIYLAALPLSLSTISSYQWHAHEMVYGYAMAVIAGFLLTIVTSWTGQQTVSRGSLAGLLLLWLLARAFFGASFILVAAVFDLLFVVALSIAVTRPIIRSKQWRQMAVVSKLILLGLGNLCFYLGVSGVFAAGVRWGIYGGLYLILGLILTMGRRLLPDYIEADQPSGRAVFNSPWLDGASLVLFVAFFVSELAARTPGLSALLALGVGVTNAVRLIVWHRPSIWQSSLLWSLYLSLWLIAAGFLLFAASHWWPVSRFLAIHALAVGGIGLVTLSMMSRVVLDYHQRRGTPVFGLAFAFLVLGTFFRVALPVAWPGLYSLWVLCSIVCWIAAFTIFIAVCAPFITGSRSLVVTDKR